MVNDSISTVHSTSEYQEFCLEENPVSKNEFITVLKARHVELDLAIEHESNRPLPDGMVVQMLKRQKLRIKDKLYRLSAA